MSEDPTDQFQDQPLQQQREDDTVADSRISTRSGLASPWLPSCVVFVQRSGLQTDLAQTCRQRPRFLALSCAASCTDVGRRQQLGLGSTTRCHWQFKFKFNGLALVLVPRSRRNSKLAAEV